MVGAGARSGEGQGQGRVDGWIWWVGGGWGLYMCVIGCAIAHVSYEFHLSAKTQIIKLSCDEYVNCNSLYLIPLFGVWEGDWQACRSGITVDVSEKIIK